MADMVASAFVQEGVSRAVSLVLGKPEEQLASQGHSAERLEMALSELEFALERTGKLRVTDLSLLRRRKILKRAYVEGTDLLGTHRRQALQGHEQGEKRKRWFTLLANKNLSISSSGGLNADDVRRYEWFADCAGRFVRDVESGCSLRHYTSCRPLVRHLLEGKAVEQETRLGYVYILPMCSEERGVEAMLLYHYKDRTAAAKGFFLSLILRLSESTDIVGIAMKCLQLLTSRFQIATDTAMGELTLLANLPAIPDSYVGIPPQMDHESCRRPDPVSCKANVHGPCASRIVSSYMSHMFPEQVIYFGFRCFISAPEHSMNSSSDEVGTSVMRNRKPPLETIVGFLPYANEEPPQHLDFADLQQLKDKGSFAVEFIGDNADLGDDNVQQADETVRSKAINCFLTQPERTDYKMCWFSKHSRAYFVVEKPRIRRTSAPETSGKGKAAGHALGA